MSLSEHDRILILMIRGYGDRTRSYEETAILFNSTNSNRNPISKSTVLRTVTRFNQTGSVKDKPRSGRPASVTNIEKSGLVLQAVIENPGTSTRKISNKVDISSRSVHRILKTHNYHPYKIHLVHELLAEDFDRRMEFCDDMMRRYDNNNHFFNWICFSDEATFELQGNVNRHNMRYWSDENPHWVYLF